MKLNYTRSFIDRDKLENIKQSVNNTHQLLVKNKDLSNELLGWMDLPSKYDRDEFQRVKETAKKIQNNSDVLIVIGIGGSYLGSRACIEALSHSFYNLKTKENERFPEIYYAGNNISSTYLMDLIDIVSDKDISINIISKSGTTPETAISFGVFKEILERKYGKEASKERIYVTTDETKGPLREIGNSEGYEMFNVPNNIGGRYSVFTAVGLLPMAVMGIDIDKLMEGAYSGMVDYDNPNLDENICYQYAAIRNILNKEGKDIEMLINYEPRLFYLTEWWKQLFGESEGKDGKGIYPASANFTTDLHSFGQLIQDGKRNIFQTVINIETPSRDMILPFNESDVNGINYISGRSIDVINKHAFQAALKAHESGGVPNVVISLPQLNEFYIGKLIYFFQKACAMSAYILGVNPFNQPAVEIYKNNMRRSLSDRTNRSDKN